MTKARRETETEVIKRKAYYNAFDKMINTENAFCEKCDKSQEMILGYGLAGGGMGAYISCTECGIIVNKIQDCDV